MTTIRAMVEESPKMKALSDYLAASPHDSNRKWAEYVALAPDLAGCLNPKRGHAMVSSSSASSSMPLSAPTHDPRRAISTTTLAAATSASTSTLDARPAAKDELSPEARRIYEYLVGNSEEPIWTMSPPVRSSGRIPESRGATATPKGDPHAVTPSTCSTVCLGTETSATPTPSFPMRGPAAAASASTTCISRPASTPAWSPSCGVTEDSIFPVVAQVSTNICVPKELTAVHEAVDIDSTDLTAPTPTSCSSECPSKDAAAYIEKAPGVDATGETTSTAAICLPCSAGGEDTMSMFLTPWSAPTSFNSLPEIPLSSPHAPVDIQKQFMGSPTTYSNDCSCPGIKVSSRLLPTAYKQFDVGYTVSTIAPWPPPSCTHVGTSLIYTDHLCHNGQQKRGKFLVIGEMRSLLTLPVQEVKYDQLKHSAHGLEVREDSHPYERIEVVKLKPPRAPSLDSVLRYLNWEKVIAKNWFSDRLVVNPSDAICEVSREFVQHLTEKPVQVYFTYTIGKLLSSSSAHVLVTDSLEHDSQKFQGSEHCPIGGTLVEVITSNEGAVLCLLEKYIKERKIVNICASANQAASCTEILTVSLVLGEGLSDLNGAFSFEHLWDPGGLISAGWLLQQREEIMSYIMSISVCTSRQQSISIQLIHEDGLGDAYAICATEENQVCILFVQPKPPWLLLAPTIYASGFRSYLSTMSKSVHITIISLELNQCDAAATYGSRTYRCLFGKKLTRYSFIWLLGLYSSYDKYITQVGDPCKVYDVFLFSCDVTATMNSVAAIKYSSNPVLAVSTNSNWLIQWDPGDGLAQHLQSVTNPRAPVSVSPPVDMSLSYVLVHGKEFHTPWDPGGYNSNETRQLIPATALTFPLGMHMHFSMERYFVNFYLELAIRSMAVTSIPMLHLPWDPGGLNRHRLEDKPNCMGEGLSTTNLYSRLIWMVGRHSWAKPANEPTAQAYMYEQDTKGGLGLERTDWRAASAEAWLGERRVWRVLCILLPPRSPPFFPGVPPKSNLVSLTE